MWQCLMNSHKAAAPLCSRSLWDSWGILGGPFVRSLALCRTIRIIWLLPGVLEVLVYLSGVLEASLEWILELLRRIFEISRKNVINLRAAVWRSDADSELIQNHRVATAIAFATPNVIVVTVCAIIVPSSKLDIPCHAFRRHRTHHCPHHIPQHCHHPRIEIAS